MELFKEGFKYGVRDKISKVEFVGATYDDPELAIHEWKYFEELNNNEIEYRKFLPKNRSQVEINRIEFELLNSIK